MIENIRDLRFDLLNANEAGVFFDVLDDADISDLQVSEAEWQHKVSGLPAKAQIRNWHLISMTQKDQTVALLLGSRDDTGESWCTSEILFVSPDRSALLTRSGSLYQLKDPGVGEPDLYLVLHIVYTLRYWGLGVIVRHFPEVFY